MSPVKSPEQHSVRDVGKKNKFVVENDETDELPPGWTKEVKTRKIGSKTKVDRRYTDPVTGYIFHSLRDVQRYLKTGEVGRLATKPKNNECVDLKDERLHMEEREEMSESKEQHSAWDVKKSDKASVFKFVVENDEADELPPGWTKELKTRKSGSKTKVDRRYMDPVTGYIFRSLKDAQRYVKTGEVGRLATKPKNNECVDTDYKDERVHIVAENDEADELPPGWTKELKTRKTGSKTKFDRRYTDPITGYIFCSLKDAQRYVRTGVLGRLALKPKNKENERLHIEDSETLRRKRPLDKTPSEFSETGKSELLHRASKRLAAPSLPEPKTHQATRLVEAAVDASVSSPSQVEPKIRNATRKAGIEINSPPPSPPDTRTSCLATPPPAPKTRQPAQQSGIKINSPPPSSRDSKTRHATPLVGTEVVPSPPPQPEPKTRQVKRLSSIGDNASPASLPLAKTRRATRQAGIEINAPPPSLPDTRTGRQATRARLVNLASPKKTEAEKMTGKHNPENHGNPKERNNEIEMGPATLPPVSFEKQELPVVNHTVSNPTEQDGCGYESNMKSDSSINFSMNDLWADPCIEFAVKTLTGAIPCEDLNKSKNPAPPPLKVPLEDLWTDPCIEFAVKTLTGAIPVAENDHLQHRPDTSRNTRAPHDFYHVGPTGQNKQQQQQQGSTFENVGFQNSGNFVNGQCSRSWFF